MRTHRDVRQLRAHPKPEPCIADPARYLPDYVCPSSDYRWGASLRDAAGMKGSGEIEVRRGWYCPDCGAPADLGDGDNVPSCCHRCGSVEPAVFRDSD